MDSYSYVAIDKMGKQKRGSMEAASKDQVNASLKSDGLIPLSVAEQSVLNKDIPLTFGKLVKPRDLSLFCRQIVGIISAGVSIIDALSMLGEQTNNKYLKKAIKETQIAVEKGETLTGAMKEQGTKIFPAILINMVEAGEASGSLEVAFERMAVHFEKDARLKSMMKKAMIYPIVVGLVAVGVIVVMMIFVIPNFVSTFATTGTKMPLITQVVMNMSNFTVKYWYGLLGATVLIVISFRLFRQSDSGKEVFSRIVLRIPLYGSLTTKSASSRYARTISTLLAAGIPLFDALEITAKTMDNVLIRRALINAKDEVARGVALSTPLKASGLFPPMVCHMTKIGEETGNIEGMLEKLADYYDEEVEIATQSFTAVLEPMIIIIMALIVGVLVVAIMQPMLSMYDGVSNM